MKLEKALDKLVCQRDGFGSAKGATTREPLSRILEERNTTRRLISSNELRRVWHVYPVRLSSGGGRLWAILLGSQKRDVITFSFCGVRPGGKHLNASWVGQVVDVPAYLPSTLWHSGKDKP